MVVDRLLPHSHESSTTSETRKLPADDEATIIHRSASRPTRSPLPYTNKRKTWDKMVIQGVIRPPPEIRAVADRTASYVAKNGRAFETRILSSAKGKTPKFAFLQDNSPFHAYYQDRIKFYEEGGEDIKEETPEAQEEKKKSDDKKAAAAESKNNIKSKATHSAIDPVAKALLTQRSKISQMKSETKSSGEDSKTEEENANQAQHVAIPPPPPPHFINIVPPSSLTIVQIETIQLVAQLTALDGKGGTFLSALTRREWNNPQFAFCQPRHGHFAYFSALVDAYRHILTTWTAKDIGADGIKEMAGNSQKCLELAAYRAEYTRHLADMRRGDEQVEVAQIDWNDFVVVETLDFGKNEQVMTLLPPPPAEVSPAKASKTGADEMEDSDDEEHIRVVPTYQPKVVSAAAASTLQTVVDPISGKSVRVQDMPEHMRIQLLDPKWAEERKKFQDKQKDSNLVGGDIVASNIARLAQARGTMNSDVLDTEEEARKRLHDANRILREQALDPKTKVGPALPGAEPKRPAPQDAAQPGAKRLRVTEVLPPVRNLAPPPPPGFSDSGAPPVNEHPFSAAGSNFQDSSTAPIGGGAQSEADFVASLPRPEVTLQVRVPNDPAQMAWNFYGQVVSLSINAMSTVKTVKQEVSRQHLNNMPVNKIQLKWVTTGAFLKDAMTLAALNIGPTATLELSPKTRGGRK